MEGSEKAGRAQVKLDLNSLIESLSEAGVVDAAEIKGCSEANIASLEKHFNLTLPARYKEFLVGMGLATGGFLGDFLITYPYLIEARKMVDQLVEKYEIPMPEKSFVFIIGDYQFYFFDTECGDDPPVYYYTEGAAVKKLSEHFSDWLLEVVDCEIETEKEIKGVKAAKAEGN